MEFVCGSQGKAVKTEPKEARAPVAAARVGFTGSSSIKTNLQSQKF